MLAVLKRDFKSYFQNVVGWLFVAVVLALFGLYFFVINLLNGYPTISNALSSNAFIMMITVPILTMRSLAEERHSKTDQLTLTAPVPLIKIILGKYLAMVAVYTIDIAVICLSPLFLKFFGTVAMTECYVAILGYWLYGCTCIAIGMFFSSITESQVVAAVSSFGALFLGYMMSSIRGILPTTGTGFFGKVGVGVANVLSYYDLYTPLNNFMNSTLDVTGIVYYVSVSAVFVFLTSQVIQKRRWTVSRAKIGTGAYSVGMIIGAIAIAVLANIGVQQIPYTYTSIDATSNNLYKITKETKDYVATLDEDVTVYFLGTEDAGSTYVKSFIETLKRYDDLSDHISVEFIDPAVNANFYTQYTDTAPSQYSVIVVSDRRSKVVDFNDVFTYEYSMNYSTYSYDTTVTGYDGEGQLTAAIQYVTMESSALPSVYQLTGHGETALSGDFAGVFDKINANLSELSLLENEGVPEDCELLIINGPSSDLSADDAEKILAYMSNGGKVLINLNVEATGDMSNLNSILEAYGMSIQTGLVCDYDGSHRYADSNGAIPYYLLPTVNSSMYTSTASASYIFVPYSSAVTVGEDTDTLTYSVIMETSDDSVLKPDIAAITSLDVEEGDIEGPFVLAAAVNSSEDGATLIVNGTYLTFTADFNNAVSGNNANYFTDIVNATVEEGEYEFIVISPKSYSTNFLTVTLATAIGTFIGFFVLFLALIIIGIVVWAKRRKK